jgi:hypothetical protein
MSTPLFINVTLTIPIPPDLSGACWGFYQERGTKAAASSKEDADRMIGATWSIDDNDAGTNTEEGRRQQQPLQSEAIFYNKRGAFFSNPHLIERRIRQSFPPTFVEAKTGSVVSGVVVNETTQLEREAVDTDKRLYGCVQHVMFRYETNCPDSRDRAVFFCFNNCRH